MILFQCCWKHCLSCSPGDPYWLFSLAISTQFWSCSYPVSTGAPVCGGYLAWVDEIYPKRWGVGSSCSHNRPGSWLREPLSGDQDDESQCSPKHNALSGSVIVKQGISGWVSPLGFPPEKYLLITLSNGHPEFVIEYDLVQWPVIAHCTIVNNLDQRTPVLAPVPLTVFRSNSIKTLSALIYNICNRSQRNFADVTTVTLSWRVQNFVVIVRAHLKTEDGKLWSNFDFDRNIVSGKGTRAGVEQGGRPEQGQYLLEPVSRKRRMTSLTAAWLQRKSTTILRW